MINLTDQEKEKFILYLEQEAATSNEIMKQMEKLFIGTGPLNQLVQREKNKVAAYLFVALDMKSYEKQTL
jgi:hypothetical protein